MRIDIPSPKVSRHAREAAALERSAGRRRAGALRDWMERLEERTLLAAYTANAAVKNVAPVVNAGPDLAMDEIPAGEGATLVASGSFSDPGADTWTATVDYGDGQGAVPLAL